MRRQGVGGAIVNVSSISGLLGFPNNVAYASAKGGMRQMSKVVAVEGAKDRIRCNSVYPGMILSDIHKNIMRETPERHRTIVARIPLGCMGEPDDVGKVRDRRRMRHRRRVDGRRLAHLQLCSRA
jgi:NAD(P)-dependent dehydrogenase (short-subunit alcohol dehydrogenase family)